MFRTPWLILVCTLMISLEGSRHKTSLNDNNINERSMEATNEGTSNVDQWINNMDDSSSTSVLGSNGFSSTHNVNEEGRVLTDDETSSTDQRSYDLRASRSNPNIRSRVLNNNTEGNIDVRNHNIDSKKPKRNEKAMETQNGHDGTHNTKNGDVELSKMDHWQKENDGRHVPRHLQKQIETNNFKGKDENEKQIKVQRSQGQNERRTTHKHDQSFFLLNHNNRMNGISSGRKQTIMKHHIRPTETQNRAIENTENSHSGIRAGSVHVSNTVTKPIKDEASNSINEINIKLQKSSQNKHNIHLRNHNHVIKIAEQTNGLATDNNKDARFSRFDNRSNNDVLNENKRSSRNHVGQDMRIFEATQNGMPEVNDIVETNDENGRSHEIRRHRNRDERWRRNNNERRSNIRIASDDDIRNEKKEGDGNDIGSEDENDVRNFRSENNDFERKVEIDRSSRFHEGRERRNEHLRSNTEIWNNRDRQSINMQANEDDTDPEIDEQTNGLVTNGDKDTGFSRFDNRSNNDVLNENKKSSTNHVDHNIRMSEATQNNMAEVNDNFQMSSETRKSGTKRVPNSEPSDKNTERERDSENFRSHTRSNQNNFNLNIKNLDQNLNNNFKENDIVETNGENGRSPEIRRHRNRDENDGDERWRRNNNKRDSNIRIASDDDIQNEKKEGDENVIGSKDENDVRHFRSANKDFEKNVEIDRSRRFHERREGVNEHLRSNTEIWNNRDRQSINIKSNKDDTNSKIDEQTNGLVTNNNKDEGFSRFDNRSNNHVLNENEKSSRNPVDHNIQISEDARNDMAEVRDNFRMSSEARKSGTKRVSNSEPSDEKTERKRYSKNLRSHTRLNQNHFNLNVKNLDQNLNNNLKENDIVETNDENGRSSEIRRHQNKNYIDFKIVKNNDGHERWRRNNNERRSNIKITSDNDIQNERKEGDGNYIGSDDENDDQNFRSASERKIEIDRSRRFHERRGRKSKHSRSNMKIWNNRDRQSINMKDNEDDNGPKNKNVKLEESDDHKNFRTTSRKLSNKDAIGNDVKDISDNVQRSPQNSLRQNEKNFKLWHLENNDKAKVRSDDRNYRKMDHHLSNGDHGRNIGLQKEVIKKTDDYGFRESRFHDRSSGDEMSRNRRSHRRRIHNSFRKSSENKFDNVASQKKMIENNDNSQKSSKIQRKERKRTSNSGNLKDKIETNEGIETNAGIQRSTTIHSGRHLRNFNPNFNNDEKRNDIMKKNDEVGRLPEIGRRNKNNNDEINTNIKERWGKGHARRSVRKPKTENRTKMVNLRFTNEPFERRDEIDRFKRFPRFQAHHVSESKDQSRLSSKTWNNRGRQNSNMNTKENDGDLKEENPRIKQDKNRHTFRKTIDKMWNNESERTNVKEISPNGKRSSKTKNHKRKHDKSVELLKDNIEPKSTNHLNHRFWNRNHGPERNNFMETSNVERGSSKFVDHSNRKDANQNRRSSRNSEHQDLPMSDKDAFFNEFEKRDMTKSNDNIRRYSTIRNSNPLSGDVGREKVETEMKDQIPENTQTAQSFRNLHKKMPNDLRQNRISETNVEDRMSADMVNDRVHKGLDRDNVPHSGQRPSNGNKEDQINDSEGNVQRTQEKNLPRHSSNNIKENEVIETNVEDGKLSDISRIDNRENSDIKGRRSGIQIHHNIVRPKSKIADNEDDRTVLREPNPEVDKNNRIEADGVGKELNKNNGQTRNLGERSDSNRDNQFLRDINKLLSEESLEGDGLMERKSAVKTREFNEQEERKVDNIDSSEDGARETLRNLITMTKEEENLASGLRVNEESVARESDYGFKDQRNEMNNNEKTEKNDYQRNEDGPRRIHKSNYNHVNDKTVNNDDVDFLSNDFEKESRRRNNDRRVHQEYRNLGKDHEEKEAVELKEVFNKRQNAFFISHLNVKIRDNNNEFDPLTKQFGYGNVMKKLSQKIDHHHPLILIIDEIVNNKY